MMPLFESFVVVVYKIERFSIFGFMQICHMVKLPEEWIVLNLTFIRELKLYARGLKTNLKETVKGE